MYECLICNYNTNKKSDYNRHLVTSKHKKKIKNESITEIDNYCSICNKQYKTELWYNKHINSKTHLEKINNNNIKETDKRISVINTKTNHIKYGRNAPLKSKLNKFLDNNPEYEVYSCKSNNELVLNKIKILLIQILQIVNNYLN
jgi:hypothetical protein